VFDKYDLDKSGFINSAELYMCLLMNGIFCSRSPPALDTFLVVPATFPPTLHSARPAPALGVAFLRKHLSYMRSFESRRPSLSVDDSSASVCVCVCARVFGPVCVCVCFCAFLCVCGCV
jgi:hypothetical protein